jgi:hypothetical protein
MNATATSEKESAAKDAGQPRHYLEGFPHGNYLENSHLFEPSSPLPSERGPPPPPLDTSGDEELARRLAGMLGSGGSVTQMQAKEPLSWAWEGGGGCHALAEGEDIDDWEHL